MEWFRSRRRCPRGAAGLLPTLAGLLTVLSVLGWGAPSALAAASPLSWSEPVPIEPGAVIRGISCPAVSFCVAVDNKGQAITSTDPTGGPGAWSAADVTKELSGFLSVSCPSPSLCVAIDGAGNVWSSTDPTGGAGAWSSVNLTEGTGFGSVATVSCASASLCVVAPDTLLQINSEPSALVFVSTNPTGNSSAWATKIGVDSGPQSEVVAMSCLSAPLCVGAGAGGDVLTTDNPTGAANEWAPADADEENNLYSVSCPNTGLCAAADIAGNVLTSTNPTGGAGAWSTAHVDGGNTIFSVSCPTAALCAAVDDQGNALASTEPTGGESAWNVTKLEEGGGYLDAVSCPSAALCIAGDANGGVLVGTSEPGGGGGGGGGGSEEGGGGGTGGGGAGGGAGGVRANLILGSRVAGGSLRLNGAGSAAGGERITGYRFKLSSTRNEIACGPQAPNLTVNFAGPTAGAATLTVIGAGGATSSASIPYSTTGPKIIRPSQHAARKSAINYRAKQPLVSAQCQAAPTSQAEELAVGGRTINAACEVQAGLVDAVGCGLHQVELCSSLPGAERQVLEAHLNQYAGCLVQREVRGAFASSAPGANTGPGGGCAFHCVPVVDSYYASTEPIRVNGLDVVPKGGASVVIAVGGLYSTSFASQHAAYLVSSERTSSSATCP